MTDGLPSGTSNLTTLPTSVIECIKVIKGPYSILYGTDAMGDVINIIQKQEKFFSKAEVSTQLRSMSMRRGIGSPTVEHTYYYC